MSSGISFTGEENYPKQPKWRAKFFLVIYSNNITIRLRKFRRKSPADRCRFATATTLILSSGPGISSDCQGKAQNALTRIAQSANAVQQKFSVG